jgi:hypothetical protein
MNVTIFDACNAECHFAECLMAECHYAEFFKILNCDICNAEFRNAGYLKADCHDAKILNSECHYFDPCNAECHVKISDELIALGDELGQLLKRSTFCIEIILLGYLYKKSLILQSCKIFFTLRNK